jgi:hypothetical protein
VVESPKPKGGTRPLGIATVEERVVQTAMQLVLEPIFEADFHDCSYGYRPKREAKQASLAMRADLYNHAWGVVEIDFKAYFTSIPHGKLLQLITKRIADGSRLKLIKQTLQVELWKGTGSTDEDWGAARLSHLAVVQQHLPQPARSTLAQPGYPAQPGSTLHRYAEAALLVGRKSAKPARRPLRRSPSGWT